MAGQVPRGSRGHGRPSRRATSWAGAPVATGVAPARGAVAPRRATTADPTASLATRPTYRKLTSLGLTPDEAGNLTAFMCGIPIEGTTWSIRQVNQLLFLRELHRTGRFGRMDGRTAPPH